MVGCQPRDEEAASEGFLVTPKPQKMSSFPAQSTAPDSALFLLWENKTELGCLLDNTTHATLGRRKGEGEKSAGSRGQIRLWLLLGGHGIQGLIGSARARGTLGPSSFPSGLTQSGQAARWLTGPSELGSLLRPSTLPSPTRWAPGKSVILTQPQRPQPLKFSWKPLKARRTTVVDNIKLRPHSPILFGLKVPELFVYTLRAKKDCSLSS